MSSSTDQSSHVSSETSVPGAVLTEPRRALLLLRAVDETVWLTCYAVLGLKCLCTTMKVVNLLLADQKKASCSPADLEDPAASVVKRGRG